MISIFFNKQYIVTRSTLTTDGVGGFTEAYNDQSVISGMMSIARFGINKEIRRAGAKESIVTHVFYCAANEDILVNDIITNGGRSWNVVSILEPGNQDLHIQCMCEEYQEGY